MSTDQPEPIASRRVDPDPSIVSAVGLRHSLETAVADLVDNSIDAGAAHVLVRFVLRRGRAVGLQVIDDGRGMDDRTIDEAMRYARKRHYGSADLGHFGLGLKAASLSQADTLLVWSRAWGAPAVGRRLRRETIDTGPMVESYSAETAAERLAAADPGFDLRHGTVVAWERPRKFLTSPDADQQTRWLEETTQRIVRHLGLVLHRLLERDSVEITMDLYDTDTAETGAPRSVSPIDPFRYLRWKYETFPQDLQILLSDGAATARMHLLPDNTRAEPAFVLDGRSASETQGFYIYRRDRLLQAGGWNGLISASPDLDFARVAVDLDGTLEQHVTFNPEKLGATFDPELSKALHRAHSDRGVGLDELWRVAKRRATEARRRHPRPITAPLPTAGLPNDVVEAIRDNTIVGDTPAVDVRWRFLPADEFYRLDRETPALILNATYRRTIVGRQGLSNDDAPLVKALVYLLVADHFDGVFQGSREKREEAAWQAILCAAVRAQEHE